VSRSDNTPWRPYRPAGPWHGGDGWNRWPLPARTGRQLRRAWHKQQRHHTHTRLGHREEPEPARLRHSVIYNYW
jgi:hypothetical protein